MRSALGFIAISLLLHFAIGAVPSSSSNLGSVEATSRLIFVAPPLPSGQSLRISPKRGETPGLAEPDRRMGGNREFVRSQTISPQKIKAWGNRLPDYPDAALEREWEGRALLRLHLREDGSVESAELRESTGRQILDQAALRAARTWTIPPESAIHSWVEVPIAFILDDEN